MARLAGPLLLGLLLGLAGCVPEDMRSPQEAALMHSPSQGATRLPAVLPRPLYFLSDRDGTTRVWRLGRDGITARPVTAPDSEVVCYDLSPRGQLAYATQSGALYVLLPGLRRPRAVVDLGERSAQTRFVSISWSPDSRQLAYVLYTPEDALAPGIYVDQVWAKDGLWLHRLAGGADTQVLRNHAPDKISDRRRVIQEAYWSPRGDALLVRMEAEDAGYYGIVRSRPPFILSAVDPQPSNTPLFGHVCWMPDGRMLLRGGIDTDGGGLALVERLASRTMLLLDGRAAGTCAAFPHPLRAGQVAFFMRGAGGRYRLHRGEIDLVRLEYAPVGEEWFDEPSAAAWEPGEQGVALITQPDAEEHFLYVPLDGGPSSRLAPDHPHPREPVWQP